MKKFIAYTILFVYYLLFLVLRVLQVEWVEGPLFLGMYLLSLPFFLMFLEKLFHTEAEIKTSLWFGLMIIASDYIVEGVLEIPVVVIEEGNLLGYLNYQVDIAIDLVISVMTGFMWSLVLILVLYIYSRLKVLYGKHKPSVKQSILNTVFLYLGYGLYFLVFTAIFTNFSSIDVFTWFAIEIVTIPGMLFRYFIIVFIIAAYVAVRDDRVNWSRVFHLGFVFFLGLILLYVIILVNPLFWYYVELIDTISDFGVGVYVNMFTVIGAVLTLLTYSISRSNNDMSKEVIFVYKAMTVLIFGFYTIFTLLSN